jgi:hypothetical protein
MALGRSSDPLKGAGHPHGTRLKRACDEAGNIFLLHESRQLCDAKAELAEPTLRFAHVDAISPELLDNDRVIGKTGVFNAPATYARREGDAGPTLVSSTRTSAAGCQRPST